MKRMKNIRLGTLVACMCVLWGCEKPNVNIVMPQRSVEVGAPHHARLLEPTDRQRLALR